MTNWKPRAPLTQQEINQLLSSVQLRSTPFDPCAKYNELQKIKDPFSYSVWRRSAVQRLYTCTTEIRKRMSVKTLETRHEGLTVFDTETGELLYHKKPKPVKMGSFDKYVGIDTKYPQDCVTKDSLSECLSVMDGYINDKPYLTSHNLLDALNQPLLTPLELKLITHIVLSLTGWNIYIGTVKDLCSCGITEANISRLIKGLDPNVLRVKHRNKPFRGDIVIEVSPTYGWKGDIRYREMKISSWYGASLTLE